MSRVWIYVFLVYFNQWCVCSVKSHKNRVCIIGAGVAGLTSAKYLKDEGIPFTVLEATKYIGGTWRYEPRVGLDENGQPVYTSMYKHLRTNLPKPTMELRGYPIPSHLPAYPTWRSYYCYLKSYAKHFDLMKYIQFFHKVVKVRRTGNVWKVKHKHVITGEEFEDEYDFIIVGNGHLSKPKYPKITGEKLFKGNIIHSHDYREPEPFRQRNVLTIGAGPSGMDISLDLAAVAKTLVHSHHSKVNFLLKYPNNYIRKPDVKELNETGAIFVDGSYSDLDDIVYCTGYEYYYPFLDDSSELEIHPTYVVPLYKYIVNINQPTMMFLGLTVRSCIILTIDAQARYATTLIKGNFTLPPRDQLLEEHQKRVDTIKSSGRPMAALHVLAEKEDQYYGELSNESGIDRVPPVMYKIRIEDMQAKIENWYHYRNYSYSIIDDENFVKTVEDESIRQHDSTCTYD